GARPFGLAALPPHRLSAGDPHHPAAAWQRLRRDGQGFLAGVGAWRRRHHADGESLRRRNLPLFRDLFDRRLHLSVADGRLIHDAAWARAAHAAREHGRATTLTRSREARRWKTSSRNSAIRPTPPFR